MLESATPQEMQQLRSLGVLLADVGGIASKNNYVNIIQLYDTLCINIVLFFILSNINTIIIMFCVCFSYPCLQFGRSTAFLENGPVQGANSSTPSA